MSITIEHVEGLLKQAYGEDFKMERRGDDKIVFGFGTKKFRDPDGDAFLGVMIQLEENGEYIKIFAPYAFKVESDNPHKRVFLEACTVAQFMSKLIQFEYDFRDGEVRPTIEFPIEDGTITAKQLARCVSGMGRLMEQYYDFLRKARDEGVIDVDAAAGGGASEEERIGMLRQLAESLGIDLGALQGTAAASSASSASRAGSAAPTGNDKNRATGDEDAI